MTTVSAQTGLPGGIAFGPNGQIDISHYNGVAAQGILRMSGNVASGETVVIGGTTFRVALVNTDTTKTVANGELNNTLEDVAVGITAHGLVGGDLVRVENEIMEVKAVLSANRVLLRRGVSGTTIAAHANATAIYTEAVTGAGNKAVGLVATLTPTAFTAALTADINDSRRCTEHVFAINPDVNTVIIASAYRSRGSQTLIGGLYGGAAIATTETLANGAWDAVTMGGGVAPGARMTVFRTPITAEVTAGKMEFVFPFVPVVERVKVITASSQAAKAWDGASTVSGNRVTIDNTGAVDWATTDGIELTVRS